MTAHIPDGIEVHATIGHVQVSGLSEDDVKQAIALLQAAGREQLATRKAIYDRLNQAMLETDLPLVSPATQRQAQRQVAQRETLLLEHGYETYRSLAEKRQSLESSVRTWVARERDKGTVFTIKAGGQVIIPSVLLTEDGTLDTAVAALVQPLTAAGMQGWSLWAWLCSPSGLLSGDVPAQVATTNPQRALKAAHRIVAEVELGRIA